MNNSYPKITSPYPRSTKKCKYRSHLVKETLEIFGDFIDQHLFLSLLAKLGYLQKIYKNLTFCKYTLYNIYELQTHGLTLPVNWSTELIWLI